MREKEKRDGQANGIYPQLCVVQCSMASRATGLAGWDDVARGHGNRHVNNGDGVGVHCTDSTTDVQTIPQVNKVCHSCV